MSWGYLCSRCDHLQSLHLMRSIPGLYPCVVDECDCVMDGSEEMIPISEKHWRDTARPHEKRALRSTHGGVS